MMLLDIRNEIDATPGLPVWEFGVKCYAVELFTGYIEDKGVSLYADVGELGPVTEDDLLNGSHNWEEYSRNGNALIACEDICMRLSGKKHTKDSCENCLSRPEDILTLQAKALEEAAKLVISSIDRALT